jgi:hypothetical protein
MEKECDGRWTAETIRKTFDYWVGKDSPTAPKAPGKMNGLLLIGFTKEIKSLSGPKMGLIKRTSQS